MLGGHLFGSFCCSHYRFVDALPVVHVLSLAPKFLELGLSLTYGQRRIEIPLSVVCIIIGVRIILFGGVAGEVVAAVLLLDSFCLFLSFFVSFFFFLLFQRIDYTVDGSIAVFPVHLGELLQRILQLYGIGIRYQFIKYLGAVGEELIILSFLIEQSNGFSIASSCIGKFFHCPVQVSEM